MKTLSFAALAVAVLISGTAHAETGAILKIEGVKGEAGVSVESDTGSSGSGGASLDSTRSSDDTRTSYSDADKDEPVRDLAKPDSDDDELTPALLELDGVKGETSKGSAAPPMRGGKDDDIDDDADDDKSIDRGSSRRATNFGILLGGSGGSDDSDETPEEGEARLRGLERARQVLSEKARASDAAIESISLNFEKITARVKKEVLLFGVVSVNTTAEVEIDENEEVKVRFPWWTFLATEKDSENLGARIKSVLAAVVKAEEDTLSELIKGTR